jgi:putative PEP-CTERM system TPR-repeat lipoprotein
MSQSRFAVTFRRTILAATVAVLAACGQDLTREELLDRARGALEEGKVNAAVVDVKTALQQSPSDAHGRRLYGEILLRQRNLPQAAEEFRRSLDAAFDPKVAVLYADALVGAGEARELLELAADGYFGPAADVPGFLAARALAEASEGNFFAAADILDDAEAIDPSDPAVRRARAFVMAQHGGDLAGAAAALAALVEEYPDDADAWSLYASILQAEGSLAEAEHAFARAGEINRFRFPDRINHMILLIEQEKYDEAKAVLEQLEPLLPDNPGVNYTQAKLAMFEGDPDKAVEELDAVLKLTPQHVPSLFLSANANLRLGNLATAQSQAESVLRAQPRSASAQLMLATISLMRGDTEKALGLSGQVLDAQPENETAKLIRARALVAEGRFDESATEYADLVAINPDSAELRAEYGEALLRAGKAEPGAAALDAAVGLAPDKPELRGRLVEAHLRSGNADAARQGIDQYRADFPGAPEPELLLAQMSLNERDAPGARQHLNAALELDPGNPVARRGLARLALIDSDPDAAAEMLSADLDEKKPDLQNLLGLAALEESRGNFEAMEEALKRAVQAYPEELAPRLLLARRALRDERPGEAVDLLTTVRDRYADDARLQQLLVGAFLALDQPGAAANAARRLAQLAPDNPVTLRLAARAELANNDFPAAEELLRDAVRLAPENMETRELLIEALYLQGDVDGASEAIAQLPEAFRDTELVDYARGRIALRLDDPEKAERLLRRAHQRNPNSASLLFLSTALLKNGRTDEAVRLLEQWVEDNPEEGVILNQLGSLLAVRGEDVAAAAAYEKLLALYPEDLIAMNNLAWSLRESDPERALELADSALRKAPGNPAVLDTRAMALMHAGDYDAALQTLDQVAEKIGEVPPLAFHRAQVLIAAGREKEARVVLEGLVDGPAFPEKAQAQALLNSL